MAAVKTLRLLLVLAFYGSEVVECQITSSPGDQTVCIGKNLDLDWVFGDAANFLKVTWAFIDNSSTPMSILEQINGLPAEIKNNFNVVHKSNGKITLTSLTQANNGSYKISVDYTSSTPSADDTAVVTVTDCSNCKCECVCKWRYLVYVSIAFGILGALVLLIIVVGIQTGRFEKKKTLLLASDGIGVFCDVLSFVLNIAFQSKKSCEASENCEDSECCKEDSDCCKGSINIASIAFIVIPIVVGFISVVIFVLVKLDKIKLGRKGGNGFFCFNNGNDGGDDGGNDGGNNGHHRGHGTNSSTVHSERADTHRGTLSDRRPMPPIPLTDKKGRGLSANYDDEHPMISVGIPDKKAGDLGPLEEESKKKKKKKKKTKNDGDEREKEENKE